ncbi:hypothetical protein U9M48_040152 [Paspalum notatum var. saurae]|uniref:Uncharacterized protein n=1 Tax=Paspalum notatum var. saurae TaxID=547442 RepID=A0AAQ3XDV2_PASNO
MHIYIHRNPLIVLFLESVSIFQSRNPSSLDLKNKFRSWPNSGEHSMAFSSSSLVETEDITAFLSSSSLSGWSPFHEDITGFSWIYVYFFESGVTDAKIMDTVKEETEEMIRAGFIRPCRYATWISSIVSMWKKMGSSEYALTSET